MGTRRDWAALRAEAQQRATAQSKHSGGARAVAAAADDLVAALDSMAPRGGSPTDCGGGGAAHSTALQRAGAKLEALLQASGPATDATALMENGNLPAAVGTQLRARPAYLQSCGRGGPDCGGGGGGTPLTPSRIILPSSPDAPRPPPWQHAMPPNMVADPTTPQKALPGRYGEAAAGAGQHVREWLESALRREHVGTQGQPSARQAALLAAWWHLCPGDDAAWVWLLEQLAAGTEPDAPQLHAALDGSVGGEAGNPGGGASGWWRGKRVHPSEGNAPAAAPAAPAGALHVEAAAAVTAAEEWRARWDRLLDGLPESANPQQYAALAGGAGLAYLRLVLHALCRAPPWHGAVAEAAPVASELTGRLASRGRDEACGHLGAYHAACVESAAQREGAATATALSRHFMQQWGFRARDLLAGGKGRAATCPVEEGMWEELRDSEAAPSISDAARPPRLPASLHAVVALLLDGCARAEVFPGAALPAAGGALLWTLQLVSAQLEAMLRALPGQAGRAERLALLSGAECCLHCLRGPLRRLLARCYAGQAAADVGGQLAALAATTEARVSRMAELAERTAVSCEVAALCAVATADVDATPWTGFRPPVSFKEAAGPWPRLWRANLFSLAADSGATLCVRALRRTVSRVLLRSLRALHGRYMALSPSTMAWRARFCGDAALMCATAFDLCHLPVAAVSSQLKGDHYLNLVTSEVNLQVAAMCHALAMRCGLLTCSASDLVDRWNGVPVVPLSPVKADQGPWVWVPEDIYAALLSRLNDALLQPAALPALSQPWTQDNMADVASIKWLVAFDALAKRAPAAEAVAALPLRGELHEPVPGLPYSPEHLEAAALLRNALGEGPLPCTGSSPSNDGSGLAAGTAPRSVAVGRPGEDGAVRSAEDHDTQSTPASSLVNSTGNKGRIPDATAASPGGGDNDTTAGNHDRLAMTM